MYRVKGEHATNSKDYLVSFFLFCFYIFCISVFKLAIVTCHVGKEQF